MTTQHDIGGTVGIHEAADLLKVHVNTVARLIHSGAIPAGRIGRAYVMMRRDVIAYIDDQIARQTAERMRSTPRRAA